MFRFAFCTLSLVFLSSCQIDLYEATTPSVEEKSIPSELVPYFTSFQAEASKHGISFDYESAYVTAEIQAINDGNVAGTCTTNGHDLRHIVIDQAFWNKASHLQREMVIYHELGHCILGRGHSEGAFSNGICRSIMRSGLGSCRDAYTPTNRAYYIDELFEVPL